MNLETRSLLEPPEFRSSNGKLAAAGVAMRYGTKSKPIDGKFRETFQPGAFAQTLTQQDIRSHNEHAGPYLGRTGNGSLRLFDSRSELAYELDLPDTSAGRDAAALLERGDIKGSSIGFRAVVKETTWSVDDDGMALRSVARAQLGRVDLTIAPYYDSSTAEMALRSLADEHHMEVRSLLEAADRGELPTLISSAPSGDDEERSEVDGRETPTVDRPHIAHLYL